MKTIIKLKINNLLKYWNYLNFLRTNGVIIFCQNLSLNAMKDLELFRSLQDSGYKLKVLNKKTTIKILNKKFLTKIKNFNSALIVNTLNDTKKMELYLKKNEISILGYYIQKYFFIKKDFKLKNIDKKSIIDHFRSIFLGLFKNKKKLITNIKYILIKFILLLKKK